LGTHTLFVAATHSHGAMLAGTHTNIISKLHGHCFLPIVLKDF
jgi:hypothetical protein